MRRMTRTCYASLGDEAKSRAARRLVLQFATFKAVALRATTLIRPASPATFRREEGSGR